eukprot:CAMPEP_0202493078 /NCGR_PEP_ID=MMETSP1361-20130828/9551_1 /ASSEMBLY_ACC=CAM_ASM_000849 /TAXON_ID=210615 /ORGANISM="Staurosira complex sp., Strain CCMP2646" /LENGTH=276 /DNA_ID=CAMNT_0049123351 /DNA_START=1543 /DNA_END=2371 /DNA_ORIENTATION=+
MRSKDIAMYRAKHMSGKKCICDCSIISTSSQEITFTGSECDTTSAQLDSTAYEPVTTTAEISTTQEVTTSTRGHTSTSCGECYQYFSGLARNCLYNGKPGSCSCDDDDSYGPICHYDPKQQQYVTLCVKEVTIMSTSADITTKDYAGDDMTILKVFSLSSKSRISIKSWTPSFSNFLLPNGTAIQELQFFTALVRSRVDPEYGVINATDKDILGIFIVPDESGAESRALIAISDKFLSDKTKNPLHDRDLSLISDFVGEFFFPLMPLMQLVPLAQS